MGALGMTGYATSPGLRCLWPPMGIDMLGPHRPPVVTEPMARPVREVTAFGRAVNG